jgi:hypothetical protein
MQRTGLTETRRNRAGMIEGENLGFENVERLNDAEERGKEEERGRGFI